MSSPFLDKFSPEIRAIIYGHVFGPGEAITPTAWLKQMYCDDSDDDWCDNPGALQFRDEDYSLSDRLIETNILAANKQIYLEAIQVLYSTQIVRGSVSRMQDLFESQNAGFWTYAKHVEITRCDDQDHVKRILPALHKLQNLPGIRSTVILSDCFTEFRVATGNTAHLPMTVSKFAQDAMLGQVTCVDIGVYQLQGKLGNVRIVNRQLVDLWPEVRNTPPGHDGVKDAMVEISDHDTSERAHNVPAWTAQTSLRCWVALQQKFLDLSVSGKWDELDEKAFSGTLDVDDDLHQNGFMFSFFKSLEKSIRLPLSKFHRLSSGEYQINDLVSGHPSELLDEATEFLAHNITGYMKVSCHITDELEPTLCTINWGANDDGETTLDLMIAEQNIALSGGSSAEFILDPNFRHDPEQNNLIDRAMAKRWLSEREHAIHFRRNADLKDPVRMTHLTHLFMALDSYITFDPNRRSPTYHELRDDWSEDLLRRYILASGPPAPGVRHLERASLGDLRTIVSTVIELLSGSPYSSNALVARFRRDEPTPSDFDADIDPQVGWTYGRLLAAATERFLSKSTVSCSLATQWMKEDSMWK
jgi:hypothetical protein